MKDTKINLCDTCKFEVPTCSAIYPDIQFGNGWGNDNVIECKRYKEVLISKNANVPNVEN